MINVWFDLTFCIWKLLEISILFDLSLLRFAIASIQIIITQVKSWYTVMIFADPTCSHSWGKPKLSFFSDDGWVVLASGFFRAGSLRTGRFQEIQVAARVFGVLLGYPDIWVSRPRLCEHLQSLLVIVDPAYPDRRVPFVMGDRPGLLGGRDNRLPTHEKLKLVKRSLRLVQDPILAFQRFVKLLRCPIRSVHSLLSNHELCVTIFPFRIIWVLLRAFQNGILVINGWSLLESGYSCILPTIWPILTTLLIWYNSSISINFIQLNRWKHKFTIVIEVTLKMFILILEVRVALVQNLSLCLHAMEGRYTILRKLSLRIRTLLCCPRFAS